MFTTFGKRLAVMAAISVFALSSARAEQVLDLTAGGSGTINGGLFATTSIQPTGSGVIDSFVRFGQGSGSKDIVAGYNTDGAFQFDEIGGAFTHSLLLADVPIVTIGGIDYREFRLDINQTGTNTSYNLNELQLFLGNAGNLTGASVDANGTLSFGSNANLVYDIDGGPNGDSGVLLNYTLESGGSGKGDMVFRIADSAFTTAFAGGAFPYIYLYSKFGDPNANNDGYEEWFTVGEGGGPPTITATPEPSAIAMVLTGLFPIGLAAWRRRRSRADNASA